MRVTYYFPWGCFHPAHGGAATVAARHLAWFRAQKWRPRIIVTDNSRSSNWTDFEKHYSWVDDIIRLNPGHAPDDRQACEPISFLKQHAALCDVAEVRRAFGAPADVVFLNYFFAASFLDLAPRNALRILETHDIFFSNPARWRLPPVTNQHHLRMELELYGLFDAAIMLNPEEAELAVARGANNAVYIPQGMTPPPSTNPDQVSGPAYDLLFVGSAHEPNTAGAEWFHRHVFLPYLKNRGVTWAIAGSVCDRLRIRDRQVHRLGRVDDLSRLYRASKAVVIPLFQGSGMSIKTLEAFAHGCAVVSTPVGLRGIRGCDAFADELNFEGNPQAVAERILALLDSPAERAGRGNLAVEFIRNHFSISGYEQRLSALFDRLSCARSSDRHRALFAA
jgi:glycosyltransferase involved in cell wall biosynthesis